MWILAGLALAEPLDAEGPYAHVVTLQPTRMAWVGPWQERLTSAVFVGPEDAFVLFGDQDFLAIGPDGSFDWDVGLSIEDEVLARGLGWHGEDGLFTWCDSKRGPMQSRNGQSTALGSYEVAVSCLVAPDGGDGWHVIEAEHFTGSVLDADGEPTLPIAFEPMEGAMKPRVCGIGRDGRMLVASADNRMSYFAIASPNPGFTQIHTRFFLDWREPTAGSNGLRTAGLSSVRSCDVLGETTVLGFDRSVLVFEGDQLVHAIRNGAALGTTGFAETPRRGRGPWAHDGLRHVRLMRDGDVLATVEASESRLRLYLREPGEPSLKKGRAAVKSGDHLLAEYHLSGALPAQAEPDLQRLMLQNRLDAGWWWEVYQDGKDSENPLEREYAVRAQSRAFIRWTQRQAVSVFAKLAGEKTPEERAAHWLDRTDAMIDAFPELSVVWEARAALAEMAGRPQVAAEARRRLASLGGPVGKEDQRAIALGRADLAALEATFDGTEGAYWAAQAAWLRGDVAGALAVLKGETGVAERLLVGRLHLASGALDDSVQVLNRLAATEGRGSAEVHRALGVAYLRRGLTELAVESGLEAQRLAPGDAATASLLVAAYADLDREREATTAVYRALSDHPDDLVLQHQRDTLAAAEPREQSAVKGPSVAILPLATGAGTVDHPGLGDLLASMLATQAIARVPIVERTRIDAVLAEQDLRRSHYVDEASALKAGTLLGAEQLVLGSAAELSEGVRLDLRVVDAESGRVLRAWSGFAAIEVDALESTLGEAARTLFADP